MEPDSGETPGFNQATARPLGQSMSLEGDTEALAAYYRDWASEYDSDVGDEDYGLPNSVLLTIKAAAEAEPRLRELDLPILDAGCGTGRVGVALAEHGYTNISGIDLSPEMAQLADDRDIYATVEAGIDLSIDPPDKWKQSADLVVVGGVFTVGHIPPRSLYCVAKLVKPGGVLATTVRPGYFNTTDYGEVSAEFVASGTADLLVHFDELPYTADTHGLYYAYRVNR